MRGVRSRESPRTSTRLNRAEMRRNLVPMDTHSFSSDIPGFGAFIRSNAIRFPQIVELVAAALAFADPNTPTWARAIIGAAVAYVICPLDAVPDCIPIAGWTDDIVVLGGVLAGAASVFITGEHRRRAREILGIR